MKWDVSYRYRVAYWDTMDNKAGETTVSSCSKEGAEACMREEMAWCDVHAIKQVDGAIYKAASNPELPEIGNGLILSTLERNAKMFSGVEAWVRCADKWREDYLGKTLVDGEVVIALPDALYGDDPMAPNKIAMQWRDSLEPWQAANMTDIRYAWSWVGDAIVVVITYHMNLS
jgi:hypothetical protein